MFEDFFISKWALIGAGFALAGTLLSLVSGVIVIVLAYRDYQTKTPAII